MKRPLVLILMVALGCSGCRNDSPPPSTARPRIISFSPALTSILFEMGLGAHVVGVTRYCELPSGETRQVVGDRQNINAERIVSLVPDVILIQQDRRDFDLVSQVNPKIGIEHFTIEKLGDIAAAVERIGKIAGDEQLGKAKRQEFEDKLNEVRKRVQSRSRPRVLFLTGLDPLTVAGRDSFIHEMIELAGGEDVTAKYQRWTQINVERMLITKPDVIICLTEPGGEQRARDYLQRFRDVRAVRDGRIFIVTDRRWTVPSTFMAELVGRLAEMIHPKLTSRGTEN